MKNLTDKDFATIKTLITAGIKTSKISEVTGRSSSTISVIARTNTLEEYRNKLSQNRSASTAKAKVGEVSGDTFKEILTAINGHLEWIEKRLGA